MLKNGGKLDLNHLEAVNFLLRKQFPSITDSQLIENVPIFSENKNSWLCKISFEPCKSLAV